MIIYMDFLGTPEKYRLEGYPEDVIKAHKKFLFSSTVILHNTKVIYGQYTITNYRDGFIIKKTKNGKDIQMGKSFRTLEYAIRKVDFLTSNLNGK